KARRSQTLPPGFDRPIAPGQPTPPSAPLRASGGGGNVTGSSSLFTLGCIGVLALGRLDDQPLLDDAGCDFDALRLAVDHGRHSLQIGLEGALRRRSNLLTDTAKVFGLTAVTQLAAGGGTGAGEIANAGHDRILSERSIESFGEAPQYMPKS